MYRQINKKQKEILAQFYSNFALAWVTFGLISPFFTPMQAGNYQLLLLRLVGSYIIMRLFLKVSLEYLR